MQESEIYLKTPRGQSEIGTKTDALTMKERRVLILVNGENSVTTLERLSLCENINEILERLLELKFIVSNDPDPTNTTVTQMDTTARDVTAHDVTDPKEIESESGAREFMCNTLLTFGNRVRVGKIVEAINASEDIASLKEMIDPWYAAIADTPGGMYQVDALKKEVVAMINHEESRSP